MGNKGAFFTGQYRNVFAECGYPEQAVREKIQETWEQLFFGPAEIRFYHPVGPDMEPGS